MSESENEKTNDKSSQRETGGSEEAGANSKFSQEAFESMSNTEKTLQQGGASGQAGERASQQTGAGLQQAGERAAQSLQLPSLQIDMEERSANPTMQKPPRDRPANGQSQAPERPANNEQGPERPNQGPQRSENEQRPERPNDNQTEHPTSEGNQTERPNTSSEGNQTERPNTSSEGNQTERPNTSSEGNQTERPNTSSEGNQTERPADSEESNQNGERFPQGETTTPTNNPENKPWSLEDFRKEQERAREQQSQQNINDTVDSILNDGRLPENFDRMLSDFQSRPNFFGGAQGDAEGLRHFVNQINERLKASGSDFRLSVESYAQQAQNGGFGRGDAPGSPSGPGSVYSQWTENQVHLRDRNGKSLGRSTVTTDVIPRPDVRF